MTHEEETKPQSPPHTFEAHEELAPCGEVCTYKGKLVANDSSKYPQLSKTIQCENIMKRMAYRDHKTVSPPPKEPPKELVDEFTISGRSPISRNLYKQSLIGKHMRYFTTEEVDGMLSNIKEGVSVNTYDNGICVQENIAKYKNIFKGGRGVAIGSISPWLETILLANGASHMTTLEYADIVSKDHRLDAYTPYDFADNYLDGEVELFDFGASFSSIEHSGMGRYTDPINPYGDLEAMAQVWCMLKPGGTFVLGVPWDEGRDYITWNANRVYGPIRLQHLTTNWKVVEMSPCANHILLVLTKDK